MSGRAERVLGWVAAMGGVIAFVLIAPFLAGALYVFLMPAGFGATCEHRDRWLPNTPLQANSYRAYLLNKGCSYAEARSREAATIFVSQADVERFADPDFQPVGIHDRIKFDTIEWQVRKFNGFPVRWQSDDDDWLTRKLNEGLSWGANTSIRNFTMSLNASVDAFVPAYNRYPLLRTLLLLVYLVLGAAVTALAGFLVVRLVSRKKAGADSGS